MVFVVGCPRSGTTFTAEAIGSVPGFRDLGEVNRLKAAIPALYDAGRSGSRADVIHELRRLLRHSQRIACAARERAIEQTPEATFLIPELAEAFPRAQFVHLIRDGRDVVASLLERGWLADGPSATFDDAGLPVGCHARFWVEPERAEEFESCGEVRRCAWAWRRYESCAASHLAQLDESRVVHLRYEELAADPAAAATRVAGVLDAGSTAAFVRGFGSMHTASVGRFRSALTGDQLTVVEAEAGALLRELGHAGAPDAPSYPASDEGRT